MARPWSMSWLSCGGRISRPPKDRVDTALEYLNRMGEEIDGVEFFCVGRDFGGEFDYGTLYALKDIDAYKTYMLHPLHLETDKAGLPVVDNMISQDLTDDDPWASQTIVYYYLALALNLIRARYCSDAWSSRRSAPPFGRAAMRPCAPRRSASTSRRHQWLAFAIAGAFAGLAGAHSPSSRARSPDGSRSRARSTVWSWCCWAACRRLPARRRRRRLPGLEIWFSTLTRFWPLVLGLIIVALVLAFPRGIVGYASAALAAAPEAAVMAVLDGRGLTQGVRRHRAVTA